DLNTYRCPDLSIMDASVGMAEYHLGGPTCDPPLGKLVGGYDPWEVDREGARLLGLDPDRPSHPGGARLIKDKTIRRKLICGASWKKKCLLRTGRSRQMPGAEESSGVMQALTCWP
ncbi:MAG: hypothetical protein ACLFRE_05960, partial [Desulfovermiculus sp.]